MSGRVACSTEERFWEKVDKTDSCWNWIAGKNDSGYGKFRLNTSIMLRAHRYAYEMVKGPIPDGLVLDHLCRNRACVNPDHLEAVTDRVNILRGESPTAVNARATHCKQGHEYTPENTRVRPNARTCMTCEREKDRRRYWSMKARGVRRGGSYGPA